MPGDMEKAQIWLTEAHAPLKTRGLLSSPSSKMRKVMRNLDGLMARLKTEAAPKQNAFESLYEV